MDRPFQASPAQSRALKIKNTVNQEAARANLAHSIQPPGRQSLPPRNSRGMAATTPSPHHLAHFRRTQAPQQRDDGNQLTQLSDNSKLIISTSVPEPSPLALAALAGALFATGLWWRRGCR
jgi:hypothetical protein